ncbi:hypothetical protein Tph_c05360 [Thermacetogenium phaeum DSM 12270]|uniref:Uncharacterized protein n=1 Tax=Thermacetogenium phaeum (strain ATCC BAA-254 / DSM 26808 / PB) TaxID=1089553 RepID=K4LRT3_THEPS|nr:hypothetical protein [Thermacetogenium phaeum]AFV10774.1 hypothetical protein Tph_c05360 [Thermacetogenium phaeum DSM 12270]
MGVALSYLRDLSEEDLYFIVSTVVDKRQDHDHICDLLKDKPDLVEIMLDDEKLFRRVREEENIFLKISPFLLFSILLLQAKKELERQSYTLEIVSRRERIPVFDARDASQLLQNKDVRAYLARMLASFTRVDSTTVVYKARGLTYQRHFSELDFDDVQELASLVELPYRYDFYKRLADISLFITGIYPEYTLNAEAPCDRTPVRYLGRSRRTLHDYEEEGRRYYDLAATYDEAREQGLDHVFSLLAEKFTTARKPLNYLAENYIYKYRNKWFA